VLVVLVAAVVLVVLVAGVGCQVVETLVIPVFPVNQA